MILYRKTPQLRVRRAAAPEPPYWAATTIAPYGSRRAVPLTIDYLDLRAQNEVFDALVGYSPMLAALNLDGRSRLAIGEIVTGNYFEVFGVGAALGRTSRDTT